MTPRERLRAARGRMSVASCGFGRRELALAGLIEELEEAEAACRALDEAHVEAESAPLLSLEEAERRRKCPGRLYERVYGL